MDHKVVIADRKKQTVTDRQWQTGRDRQTDADRKYSIATVAFKSLPLKRSVPSRGDGALPLRVDAPPKARSSAMHIADFYD